MLFSVPGFAATVAGTVKGPDGAPFEGAFVQAVNSKTRISVSEALLASRGATGVETRPPANIRCACEPLASRRIPTAR